MAKSAEEVRGLEYDWLAIDADGHVAFFSTAGGGLAPAEFLADTESHDEAIQLLLGLPVSTLSRFSPALASDAVNTWCLVAERGLFAFDANPNGGPYHLVAAPEVPVTFESLPKQVASVACRLELNLSFSQLAEAASIADDLFHVCS
jgi:hypothetical protein